MAKPRTTSPASWGTVEDLLLAFAVNRHGVGAWDSIASELRKRAGSSVTLTPQNCRLRYNDLKRRFSTVPNHDLDDDNDKSSAAPLLEKLRKLRVVELRREVQRYNLNIESLELKVKKMEEEREQSLREENKSDLEEKRQGNIRFEPPEPATSGEPITEEDLERGQFSVNESNYTDLRGDKLKTGVKEPEAVRKGEADETQDPTGQLSEELIELKSEPDRNLILEDSCNGSSYSIEKPDRKAEGEAGYYATGLIVLDAETGGGGEDTTMEIADVQSSASIRRRKKGTVMAQCEKTCGIERKREEQSRAVNDLSAESQPLINFLQTIRTHKFGSVFERRLRSQQTSKYQKVVLRHVDFETVETRLKEGWYSSSTSQFFRDLLLLVNNALIFFGNKSVHAKAATEIRQVISKEISKKRAMSNSSASRKPRILNSIIVCRKRSSIAAKAAATDKRIDEKDRKQHSLQTGSSDQPKVTKKRTRVALSSMPTLANTKKICKNRNSSSNKDSASESGKQQGKGGLSASSQPAEPKGENEKNPSSNNGALVNSLKNRPLTNESTTTSSKGGGSSKLKKKENSKRGGKKEAAGGGGKTRQTKKKGEHKHSPGKRNFGRPPKRGAAPAPSPVLDNWVGKKPQQKSKLKPHL